MAAYLSALKGMLDRNEISKEFAKRFFSKLSEKNQLILDKIMQMNALRYKKNKDLHLLLRGCLKKEDEIDKMFALIPSFIFRISSDMVRNPDNIEETKSLLIALVMVCIVPMKDNLELQTQIFFKNIDPQDDYALLNKKLNTQDEDFSFFPKLLNHDILIISKHQIAITSGKDISNQIEALFFFMGYSQFFLRYYFNLLVQAQSDSSAKYIHAVFILAFNAIRIQEVLFWKNYGPGNTPSQKIIGLVAEGNENQHPILKKNVFEELVGFFPLLFDKTVFVNQPETQSLIKDIKKSLDAFTTCKLAYFLDGVRRIKGNTDLVKILTVMRTSNQDRIFKLYNYLRDSKEQELSSLTSLLSTYTSKLTSTGPSQANGKLGINKTPGLLLTEDSVRQMAAKQRLSAMKDQNSLTQDKVRAYLDDIFKKLLTKFTNPNALNQHNISEYLSKLEKNAKNIISKPVVTKKDIKEFTDSTCEILESITDQGEMGGDEIEEFKDDILCRSGKLASEDIEERVSAIEQIGKTISKADLLSQGADLPEELELHQTEIDIEEFLGQKIIPISFEKEIERITAGDFFSFPFAEKAGPHEEDWFAFHMSYLRLALETDKLNMRTYKKVIKALPKIPKVKYKKYFNIFPNDEFDDSIFHAVISLWNNKGLHKLIVS
ncbi:MAG: hypothetical protein OEY59_11505 [Deltaproteobacteria bacterium]|nr:hypothetical protein [Deltaproteobacteria bacterium]